MSVGLRRASRMISCPCCAMRSSCARFCAWASACSPAFFAASSDLSLSSLKPINSRVAAAMLSSLRVTSSTCANSVSSCCRTISACFERPTMWMRCTADSAGSRLGRKSVASPRTATVESAGRRSTVGLKRKVLVKRRSVGVTAILLTGLKAGVLVGSGEFSISVSRAASRTPKSSSAVSFTGSTSVSRMEISRPRSPRSTRGAASLVERRASSQGATGLRPSSSCQSKVAWAAVSSLSAPLLKFSARSSKACGSV